MRSIALKCAACVLALGCQAEVPRPTERQVVIHVNAMFTFPYCPIITGLSASPLEVVIGSEVSLRAEIGAGLPAVTWRSSSAASQFGDRAALETTYRCLELGEQLLTLTVEGTHECKAEAEVPVTCSPSPTCGDGRLDDGEQCDDGNREPNDGCSALCMLEVD